jgi:hypothetical protein
MPYPKTTGHSASAPFKGSVEYHGRLFGPGFHVVADLERDSRFGLKFALDLASGPTMFGQQKAGTKVALLVPKRPNNPTAYAIDGNTPGSNNLHLEFVDANGHELVLDQLARICREVMPDVIVVDAFNPVRRPGTMNIEVFADTWAKIHGIAMFGIPGLPTKLRTVTGRPLKTN